MGKPRSMNEHRAARIARWLGERTGRPPLRYEKVQPGDEQVLPDREQRELDALPSRLARHSDAA
jgi:hypothetical protein